MKTLNITAPPDWMGDALCAQVDHDLFYPEKGGSTKEAKRVCLNCKVRAQCLEYALESADPYGIWGGTSERERRRILARQDAQPEPEQAREAATRRASAEELEDWPTTQEAAERLGITFNQRSARRLRNRGIACVKPSIMGPGQQLRWNPQQLAEAVA